MSNPTQCKRTDASTQDRCTEVAAPGSLYCEKHQSLLKKALNKSVGEASLLAIIFAMNPFSSKK